MGVFHGLMLRLPSRAQRAAPTGCLVTDKTLLSRHAMTDLDELHRQYRHSLSGKREDLRRAWDALCDEDASAAQVAHLHFLLHRLVGSAGTYGHDGIANHARVLEHEWTAWMAASPQTRAVPYLVCLGQAERMAGLLDALQAA